MADQISMSSDMLSAQHLELELQIECLIRGFNLMGQLPDISGHDSAAALLPKAGMRNIWRSRGTQWREDGDVLCYTSLLSQTPR